MATNSKDKFYFESIESETCYPLPYHIEDAKFQGLKEITLIEANEDNIDGIIWCGAMEATGDKSECNKKKCSLYHSKSGRGVCSHRGNLYEYGEEVTFKISDYGN